jgi:hypothetical protein
MKQYKLSKEYELIDSRAELLDELDLAPMERVKLAQYPKVLDKINRYCKTKVRYKTIVEPCKKQYEITYTCKDEIVEVQGDKIRLIGNERDACANLGFSYDQLRALLYSEGTLKGKSYDFAFNYKVCSTCKKMKNIKGEFYDAKFKNGKFYSSSTCKKCNNADRYERLKEQRNKNK